MQMFKNCLVAISALLLLTATACSPVKAQNEPNDQTTPNQPVTKQANIKQDNKQILANQSTANKTTEEKSIWVRLAKPTCH